MLMSPVKAMDETPSPKQLARRALIVQAAVETLKREGIAGCTVRAIAEATPFTKGTIHYYFNDVREIVNTAYLQLTDDYVASVEGLAGQAPRPAGAFWRAVASYLEGFRAHRGMGLLWFEYSSWAVRNGYGHGVASSVEAIRLMFARSALHPRVAVHGTSGWRLVTVDVPHLVRVAGQNRPVGVKLLSVARNRP